MSARSKGQVTVDLRCITADCARIASDLVDLADRGAIPQGDVLTKVLLILQGCAFVAEEGAQYLEAVKS